MEAGQRRRGTPAGGPLTPDTRAVGPPLSADNRHTTILNLLTQTASLTRTHCTIWRRISQKRCTVLLIDYMPHRVPVTGVYYADLLGKLFVAEESWPRYPYFCTTMQLLTGHTLDKPLYLNVDLYKCPIHISSWSDTTWLSPVSKFKETPPWTDIFDRQWAKVCGGQKVLNCFILQALKTPSSLWTVEWQRRCFYVEK